MRKFAVVMVWFLVVLSRDADAEASFRPGTVASYAGKTIVTGGVTYSFPSDDYSFSGSGLEPIEAGSVIMRPDPQGPNTILFSCPYWVLNRPYQKFSIDIKFQVTGANVTGGWQHGAVATGDGRVEESTNVEVSPPAVSSSFQTATNGVDLTRSQFFDSGPHNCIVHIDLSTGQRGTANLRSYGTHFGHR